MDIETFEIFIQEARSLINYKNGYNIDFARDVIIKNNRYVCPEMIIKLQGEPIHFKLHRRRECDHRPLQMYL